MFELFAQSEKKLRPLESYEYVEYLEEGGGASAGQLSGKTNDLRIRMTDRDLVTLPADSFLQAQYEVAQNDNAPINAATPFTTGKIAPVNGGWNLFKRSKYLLSNEVAEDISRPGYVRQVKGLIEYDDDFERGQGHTELWLPDRYNGLIDEEFIGVSAYNRTQNYTIPNASINLSAADPHVVSIVDEGGNVKANGDVIDFKFNGSLMDVIVEEITITEPQANPNDITKNYTKVDLVVSAGGLTYVGAVVGSAQNVQIIHFKIHGADVDLRALEPANSGYGTFNYNGVLIFTDGSALVSNGLNVSNLDDLGIYQNTGFEARRAKIASDRRNLSVTDNVVNLFMPLRRLFPILKSNPIIMRGIEQELNFDLNDFQSILYRDAAVNGNADGKIILRKLSWWMPVLKPTLLIKNEINKMLNSGDERVMKWDSSNHFYSESRTETSGSWLIKTSEHRPVRVYIFFQTVAKFKNQQENNMIFDNYDLERIFVRINSDRQFPNKEYRIKYTPGKNQDYMRVYAAYLTACGVIHSDNCKPSISYEEFRTIYPLYYFDLSNQDESVWESTTQAHLTVEYTMGTNGGNPITPYYIHAVLDTEREITIQGINGRMTRIK